MLRCISCKYNNDCTKVFHVEIENCTEYYPRTNADRIRAMTDEELASIISWLNDSKPAYVWLKWLRQEVTSTKNVTNKIACKCYHADKNFLGSIGVCWGTKECEACSCGGDELKCDFYDYVRERAEKHNADKG